MSQGSGEEEEASQCPGPVDGEEAGVWTRSCPGAGAGAQPVKPLPVMRTSCVSLGFSSPLSGCWSAAQMPGLCAPHLLGGDLKLPWTPPSSTGRGSACGVACRETAAFLGLLLPPWEALAGDVPGIPSGCCASLVLGRQCAGQLGGSCRVTGPRRELSSESFQLAEDLDSKGKFEYLPSQQVFLVFCFEREIVREQLGIVRKIVRKRRGF